MLHVCFVGSEFKGTDVMYLCRMLIYFIFFVESHVGKDVNLLKFLCSLHIFLDYYAGL